MITIFKRGHNLAYILILNLLYPAVLGSIFYSVLSNISAFKIGVVEISCALMMISVIIFFSIDFLYTYLHDTYNSFHFIFDCILLFIIQGAFSSINFLAGNINSRRYCLYMFLTFLIFLVWDYPQRKELGKKFLNIIKLEFLICPAFLLLTWREKPGYLIPAIISIVGSLLMSKFFLVFYRNIEIGSNTNIQDRKTLSSESTRVAQISVAQNKKKAYPNYAKISFGALAVLVMITFKNGFKKGGGTISVTPVRKDRGD